MSLNERNVSVNLDAELFAAQDFASNALVVPNGDNSLMLNSLTNVSEEKHKQLDETIAAMDKQIKQLNKEVAELKRQLPNSELPDSKPNHLDSIL